MLITTELSNPETTASNEATPAYFYNIQICTLVKPKGTINNSIFVVMLLRTDKKVTMQRKGNRNYLVLNKFFNVTM